SNPASRTNAACWRIAFKVSAMGSVWTRSGARASGTGRAWMRARLAARSVISRGETGLRRHDAENARRDTARLGARERRRLVGELVGGGQAPLAHPRHAEDHGH